MLLGPSYILAIILCLKNKAKSKFYKQLFCPYFSFVTPQPLRAVRVLFHQRCPDGLAGSGKKFVQAVSQKL